MQEIVGYGSGYTVAEWTWQIRDVIKAVVIGRFLGPQAVGYVSVAVLIVRSLEFAKGVMYRLSLVAFGRIQRDWARLGRAVEEAGVLQVLATGPLLAGFALIAPWAISEFLGERWTPVLKVFSFVALGAIVNSVFNFHSSLLHVVGRNRYVTYFHIVMVAIFTVAASLLVPRYGLIGYGLSETIALASYTVLHVAASRVTRCRIAPWFRGSWDSLRRSSLRSCRGSGKRPYASRWRCSPSLPRVAGR